MYNIETLQFFQSIVEHTLGGFAGKRVLELGNQEIWEHARVRCGVLFPVAKSWYSSMGAEEHISLDMNGRDGAIQVDLGKRINCAAWRGRFDLVTNVGTLEHVGEWVQNLDDPTAALGERMLSQYTCLANMHNFTVVGGLIAHALMPKGDWDTHCMFRHDERFVEVLARLNRYEIVACERTQLLTLNPDAEIIHVLLRKMHGDAFSSGDGELAETIEFHKDKRM